MTRKICFLVSDRLSHPDSVEVTSTRKLEVSFRHGQKQMARLSLDLIGKSRLPFLGVAEQGPSSWVRRGHAERALIS